MSRYDQPAVRKGDEYCAPWCGCHCKYADFEARTRQAADLVALLGPAWTPRVWENGGWHGEAVAGCWNVKISPPSIVAEPDEGPTYQAWFNGPGVGLGTVQFIDDEYSADPLETLQRVKRRLDEWHLALLPKLHLPLPGQGPTRATDGTAWEVTMPSEMDRLQGDDHLRVKLLGRTPADIDAAYRSLLENCGWNGEPMAERLYRAIRQVHADGHGVALPSAVELMEPVHAGDEERLREYARDVAGNL